MSFVDAGGHWNPEGGKLPLVPESEPDTEFSVYGPDPLFATPYVNPELWRETYSQAGTPTSIWENIKFGGAIFARAVESTPLPLAEWDATGRGMYMPNAQHPSIVAGNLYNNQVLNPMGPFRDPRQSQAVIEAYLAQAMPRETAALEGAVQVGGGLNGYPTPGYGASGG